VLTDGPLIPVPESMAIECGHAKPVAKPNATSETATTAFRLE